MSDARAAPQLLLGLFAAFYEEVARLKHAVLHGTLADSLADGDGPVHAPDAQARAASGRLVGVLEEQMQRLRQHGSDAQMRLHRIACYLMAALADEVFIFELAWPGQQGWLATLVEHRVFGSRRAGRRFFELADELLASPSRDELHRDLASCFLLALQLGFKGVHRGARGVPVLDELRQRLWQYAGGAQAREPGPVFPEAYEVAEGPGRDERLAPLGPWLRWAGWGAGAFLALSSMLWLAMVQPLAGPGSG